jgi:hypothetical protein
MSWVRHPLAVIPATDLDPFHSLVAILKRRDAASTIITATAFGFAGLDLRNPVSSALFSRRG